MSRFGVKYIIKKLLNVHYQEICSTCNQYIRNKFPNTATCIFLYRPGERIARSRRKPIIPLTEGQLKTMCNQGANFNERLKDITFYYFLFKVDFATFRQNLATF